MLTRYYVPGLGRFASADSIIPNPANPQSYNRYAYVLNRPLNLIDPTGYRECDMDLNCDNPLPHSAPPPPPPAIPGGPMVTFSGCETCTWTDEEMATIMQSANDTGAALARTLNAAHGWNLSASDAFLLVYGGSVNFNKTGQSCLDATGSSGCWGSSTGRNNIDVYTDAGSQIAGDVHWAVHELGHSFVNAVGAFNVGGQEFVLPSLLEAVQGLNNGFPDRPPGSDRDSTWGFAGGRWEWQRSSSGLASEEFADMYLGWVYNQWETIPGTDILSPYGSQRSDFMNAIMPFSVDLAIGR